MLPNTLQMLSLDDFFLLHQPFTEAVADQLPLPSTVELYALTPEGAMQPLPEHLRGERSLVPENIHVITQPWQADGQLIFPFPLSSGEMATAVVSDVDPAFLRKMSASWLREVRELLLKYFTLFRQGCVDLETKLYNRRALLLFLQSVHGQHGGFFLLINTVFYRKTAAGKLQKWRETADLLPALAQGQYFSFGFGVFGLYLASPSRKVALKTARNLQYQLRREGMNKVQIGFTRLRAVPEEDGEEVVHRFERALAVAEHRGPFGLCDIDAVDARPPYPLFTVPEVLRRIGSRFYRHFQQFTLALISFRSVQETLEAWPQLISKIVAPYGAQVVVELGEVLLIFPDRLQDGVTGCVEAVLDDARKRFGAEAFVAGVASWPTLDYTKGEVLGNCRKAQRHAAFLGAGSVVYFDQLSLNISGDAFFDEGDYRAALREYRRGLRLQPDDVNLINSLGVALVECNQLRSAAKCFQDVLTLEHDNYMALVNLGKVRQSLGEPDGALACFEQAYARHAEDSSAGQELFLPLAWLSMEAGKFDQAIAVLLSYLQRPGHEHEYLPFRLLGLCYLEVGQAKEAIQACQRVLKLFPHDSISLSVLGLLYVEQGEGGELGLSLCDKGLELDNFNPDHWYRLARARLHLGDDTGALSACKQCLRLQRTHAACVVLLGMVYKARGRVSQARHAFLRALSLKGCNPALVDQVNTLLATL